MKKGNWFCVVVFMVVLQMLFFWSIDISVSALINYGVVTNGLFSYHIALYGAILNTVAQIIIIIHLLEDKK
jgi:hypothetical protein